MGTSRQHRPDARALADGPLARIDGDMSSSAAISSASSCRRCDDADTAAVRGPAAAWLSSYSFAGPGRGMTRSLDGRRNTKTCPGVAGRSLVVHLGLLVAGLNVGIVLEVLSPVVHARSP